MRAGCRGAMASLSLAVRRAESCHGGREATRCEVSDDAREREACMERSRGDGGREVARKGAKGLLWADEARAIHDQGYDISRKQNGIRHQL